MIEGDEHAKKLARDDEFEDWVDKFSVYAIALFVLGIIASLFLTNAIKLLSPDNTDMQLLYQGLLVLLLATIVYLIRTRKNTMREKKIATTRHLSLDDRH